MNPEQERSDPDPCPDPDRLAAFDRGRLSGSALEAVAAHLAAGCDRCRALERPDDKDSLIGDLRRTVPAGVRSDPDRLPNSGCEEVPDGSAPPAGTGSAAAEWPAVPGYEILGELGRGGMGVVLRGRDPDFHRTLAVKVLRAEYQDQPELARRFLEEAQVMGQMQHPGIAPVHQIGRLADGRPFFTMKLIQGRTLAELLDKRPSPADDLLRLLAVFAQVCQTLAYAHSRGVIHRDLKPSNVMVGAFGEVQVMDWGLAKVLNQASRGRQPPEEAELGTIATIRTLAPGLSSQAGSVLGTPAYMAPEQARGEVDRLNERCDVFGLGAVLCEILTGQPPFSGPTPEAVRRQAERGDLADVFARLDGCGADAALGALVKQCLAPGPEERPRDAGVVAGVVAAYQAGVQERLRQAELEREAARVRALEEGKRRRLRVGMAAAVLGLVVLGGGGGLWLQGQERRGREAVEAALVQVEGLTGQWRWAEAEAVLVQAQSRLGWFGGAGRRRRLEQAWADLTLVRRLDAIRLERSAIAEDRFDDQGAAQAYGEALGALVDRFTVTSAAQAYGEAFRGAGLGVEGADPAALAARIKDSPIRAQLVSALDDWALATVATGNAPRQSLLLQVACAADPDGWRDRLRDPRMWRDKKALETLAREEAALEQSAQLLTVLSKLLMDNGSDAESLLRAAQQRHPADFWLNVDLGTLLIKRKPEEGAAFLRAALALRPQSSAVHNNLGVALRGKRLVDQAIAAYREAIRLDPANAKAHSNLGNTLSDKGLVDPAIVAYREAIRLNPNLAPAHTGLGAALHNKDLVDPAIAAHREAIRLDPNLALAHTNLGITLRAKRRLDEAIAAHREAIRLDPNLALARHNLGLALRDKGLVEEAIAACQKAVALDPGNAKAHNDLGVTLQQQKGRLDEAIAAYREAIRLDPSLAPAHTNLGVALQAKGRLDEAIAAHQRAVALDPQLAKAHTNLGNAWYARGRLDEAIAAYQKAVACDPKNAVGYRNLGAALYVAGRLDEAIDAFQKTVALEPGNAKVHTNLGAALYAAGRLDEAITAFRKAIALGPEAAEVYGALGEALLRRGDFAEAAVANRRALELLAPGDALRTRFSRLLHQCERLAALDAKLSAILLSGARPAGAAEQLELANLCQRYKQRYAAAAYFYEEAFVEQPQLADDLKQQHRYNAACAAALAGSGQGEDVAQADEPERARWRQRAVDWLRADLALWTRQLEQDTPQARAAVQKALHCWQGDTAFAGLRDPAALTKLPEKEREACRRLWAEVETLLARTQGK